MARKYLIPLLSILMALMLGFSLQAHAPSLKDFLGWFGLMSVSIGSLEVLVGLILLITPQKILARELLITGGLLLLIGAGTCTYAMR